MAAWADGGMGYGGMGYGMGYGGMGYGMGYGGMGYGYGYPGFGYGGGYAGYYGTGWRNPMFGVGLTPLGTQSYMTETRLFNRVPGLALLRLRIPRAVRQGRGWRRRHLTHGSTRQGVGAR